MKDKKDDKTKFIINSDNVENTVKYGEFICSLDHWLPIDKQKEIADKLNKVTKKDKN